jgi:hypothetical protein
MITSVYIDTDELVFQLHSVSDDAQKALEWVRAFRDTLMFGARIPNPLPFAMECMAMSEGFSASGVLGKLRAAARKRLNDEGIEATPESIDAEIARTQGADAVRDIMAKIERANRLKAEIRRRKFTAAATTREAGDESTIGCNNSQVAPTSNAGDESSDARKCAALKSATSCNPLTADGDTREDSQAKPDGSAITRNETRAHDALRPSANHYGDAATREGAEVSTTVSRNMRRVPQNEAPAHGFSGGRTAQGTMSRSPEAAAQSGKDYDQEPYKVSTDEALESQHGAGEVPPENVSAKPSPALSVPAKRPHGEFGNVMLTDDEFAKLQEKLPNAWDLITELDQYIESQGKTKKYKSHYATLLNWSRRKAQEAKPKQGYLTSDDISKKNYQESKARLEAMFSKGRETA